MCEKSFAKIDEIKKPKIMQNYQTTWGKNVQCCEYVKSSTQKYSRSRLPEF